MRLHHYTNAWPEIDTTGVILANWRGLAHLSISDNPAGLSPVLASSRYRITVELPRHEVHEWKPWAFAHLPDARALTADRYLAPDGSWRTANPDEWYVIERDIPRAEWLWVVRFDGDRAPILWHNPHAPLGD